MSKTESTQNSRDSQAPYSGRYDDSENWTPQQAAEYARWLSRVTSKNLEFRKNRENRPVERRSNEIIDIEADILAGLKNACRYAEMAQLHADVFDEVGFVYDLEEFIAHAKLVAGYLRSYKDLMEF